MGREERVNEKGSGREIKGSGMGREKEEKGKVNMFLSLISIYKLRNFAGRPTGEG